MSTAIDFDPPGSAPRRSGVEYRLVTSAGVGGPDDGGGLVAVGGVVLSVEVSTDGGDSRSVVSTSAAVVVV
jgi:hypothetical protein